MSVAREAYLLLPMNVRTQIEEKYTEVQADPTAYLKKGAKMAGDNYRQGETNPEWLYTHWNWGAWPLEAQQYWIDKWKTSHPSNYVSLYQLLKDNQGDWYYINNFISNHNDTGPYSYTNIPDPTTEIAKLEPGRIKYFYENLVPYAGTFVIWFRQMNQDLIFGPDLTKIKFKLYTTAPGLWFEMKKDETIDLAKKGLKAGKKLAGDVTKGASDFASDLEKPILYGAGAFAIGILALGAIAVSRK